MYVKYSPVDHSHYTRMSERKLKLITISRDSRTADDGGARTGPTEPDEENVFDLQAPDIASAISVLVSLCVRCNRGVSQKKRVGTWGKARRSNFRRTWTWLYYVAWAWLVLSCPACLDASFPPGPIFVPWVHYSKRAIGSIVSVCTE
ncbi:hypothetical protein BDV29DRAFT_183250 [Aspergillus leporis]|uniref:Uncharacterized protein n=1 Tax=Aspergillus leporis TaxID=41062 RepID=A0A5N5WNB3_9EURO|nr:hypothetical protein BDV29DRAFT_183250 [Aspergillus leporis]